MPLPSHFTLKTTNPDDPIYDDFKIDTTIPHRLITNDISLKERDGGSQYILHELRLPDDKNRKFVVFYNPETTAQVTRLNNLLHNWGLEQHDSTNGFACDAFFKENKVNDKTYFNINKIVQWRRGEDLKNDLKDYELRFPNHEFWKPEYLLNVAPLNDTIPF